MKPEELIKFPIVPVERSGITREALPPHVTMGIWAHSASEHYIGCGFGDAVLQRTPYDPITGTPAESVDACVWRAARELVPLLPDSSSRTANGAAIGYLIYAGLPVDHCRPVSTHGS